MLKASSLSPILDSTIRLLVAKCSHTHRATHFQHSLRKVIARNKSTLRPLEERGEGDVHGPQRSTLHASLDAEEVTSTKEESSAESNTLGSQDAHCHTAEPSDTSFVHYMLDRERKGWAGEPKRKDIYVREKPPYITGKSRHFHPLPPLYGGKFKRGSTYANQNEFMESILYPEMNPSQPAENDDEPALQVFTVDPTSKSTVSDEELFYQLCHVIATTDAVEKAWTAYSTILTIPLSHLHRIPFQHLHRLCRLLAQTLPRTRTQFLRLLSVLYTIRRYGGVVQLFEWNALIANAGAGWRKTTVQDFKLALDVFGDMVSGLPPGYTYSPSEYPLLSSPPQNVTPNIYTYNTLISIASRTLYGRALERSMGMLRSSGHSPDRVTHLSLLVFFTNTRQLAGVRSTLLKMRQQRLELGLDGINACIWAHGLHPNMSIVNNIYRVLRHNIHPEPADDILPVIEALQDEGIDVPPLVRPNQITYSAVIQLNAWSGNLDYTLDILMDMLSTENMDRGAPLTRDEDGTIQYTAYSPLYTVFRAIFLGFSRHGVYLSTDFSARLQKSRQWTLNNLRSIYDTYMTLPDPIEPSHWMIYWIMVSFDRCSGHDVELLRRVWGELVDRYKGPWGGPRNRLQTLRTILFSDDAESHLQKHGFRTKRVRTRSGVVTRHDANPFLP